MPKAKTKTKPKKQNNVVKLDEVKEEKKKPIKEKNFTLDRGTDGNFIVRLNYYYNNDPNRWFTTWDAINY